MARELAAIHVRTGGSYEGELVPILEAEHEPLPQPVQELLEGSASGYSLAELRDMLGGEEGMVTSPNGTAVRLSIRPWMGKESERFLIRFRFSPSDQEGFNRAVRALIKDRRPGE